MQPDQFIAALTHAPAPLVSSPQARHELRIPKHLEFRRIDPDPKVLGEAHHVRTTNSPPMVRTTVAPSATVLPEAFGSPEPLNGNRSELRIPPVQPPLPTPEKHPPLSLPMHHPLLAEERRRARLLKSFRAALGGEDSVSVEESRFYLESSGWDLDEAVRAAQEDASWERAHPKQVAITIESH